MIRTAPVARPHGRRRRTHVEGLRDVCGRRARARRRHQAVGGEPVGRHADRGRHVGRRDRHERRRLADAVGSLDRGKPTDTTPFVIVGPEAQLGAVTFGDRLTDQPVTDGPGAASSGPTLPDLRHGQAVVLCRPHPRARPPGPADGPGLRRLRGQHRAVPFTADHRHLQDNITSLPLGPDRIMVRTGSPLLTADFPIETKVDLSANAGFFQVRLEGELSVCNSSAAADCSGAVTGNMLTIGLKQAGDAQHDLRLRDLFAQLVTSTPTGPSQAGGLLDVDVNVRAAADMAVSIPEAAGFLPAGTDVSVSATWADLTQLSALSGPQLDLSKLDRIFALDIKPGSQAELFAIVLRTLQTLAAQLAEAQPGGAGGVYSKEIPGLGVSLRDLMRRDASGQGADVNYGDNTLQHVGRVFDASFVGRSVVVGTQVAVVASASGDTVTLTENWTNKPVNDTAYSFRSPLDDAIDAMSAHPPQNMQDLVALLDRQAGNGRPATSATSTTGAPRASCSTSTGSAPTRRRAAAPRHRRRQDDLLGRGLRRGLCRRQGRGQGRPRRAARAGRGTHDRDGPQGARGLLHRHRRRRAGSPARPPAPSARCRSRQACRVVGPAPRSTSRRPQPRPRQERGQPPTPRSASRTSSPAWPSTSTRATPRSTAARR